MVVKNEVTFTIEGDCSIEAVFTKAPLTITTIAEEGGHMISSGKKTGILTIEHGAEVEITAIADDHYGLINWKGTCGEFGADESTIMIAAVEDCTIEAVFEKVSYNIKATSSDGGSVSDEELSVKYQETATLTATPLKGYQFSGWSTSDCLTLEDTSNPKAEFIVGGNCSLEAKFSKSPHTITAIAEEGGYLTSDGKKIGTLTVEYSNEVEITAITDDHYQFRHWKGTCGDFGAGKTHIMITAVEDCTIEAVFEHKRYTIKATSSEGGSLSDDELTKVYGEIATLKAIPQDGYQFSEWTSEDCPTLEDSEDVQVQLIVQGDCSLHAVFEKLLFNISVSSSEGGSVDSDGQQIDKKLTKEYGQTVIFRGTAEKGYVFDQWETAEQTDCPSFSDEDISGHELTFTVLGDCELKAVFTPKSYTISTSSNEGGEITDTFMANEGEEVSITATFHEHHEFKKWGGTCGEFNSEDLTISFEASKDCAIEAVFTKAIYTLTADADGGGSVDKSEEKIGFGEQFEVKATPDDGYDFERWTSSGFGCPDDLDSTYSFASFKVEGDCHLEAEFTFTGEYDEPPDEEEPVEVPQVHKPYTPEPKISIIGIVEKLDSRADHPNHALLHREKLSGEWGSIESKMVRPGQRVTLEVEPESALFEFVRWEYESCTNNAQENGLKISFTAQHPCTIKAFLVPNPIELHENGMTVKLKDELYDGEQYGFVGWKGWIMEGEKPKYYTIVGDRGIYGWTEFKIDIIDKLEGSIPHRDISFKTMALWGDKKIENVVTTYIKNMDELFYCIDERIYKFNLDIRSWDTSNVISMQKMFGHTDYFNRDLSHWNVEKVTNMYFMFGSASAFSGDISTWNVDNVEKCKSFVDKYSKLNKLPNFRPKFSKCQI